MVEKSITVQNRAGIHARPAALIAQTANKFQAEIEILRDTTTVNAKSIMGVITLAAGYKSLLTLRTNGTDEQDAMAAICALFDNKFEEE
jgi:phosphocarrier protein